MGAFTMLRDLSVVELFGGLDPGTEMVTEMVTYIWGHVYGHVP